MNQQDKEIIESVEKYPDEVLSISKARLLKCAEESTELRHAIGILCPDLKIDTKLNDIINQDKLKDFRYLKRDNHGWDEWNICDSLNSMIQIRADGQYAGKGLFLDHNIGTWKVVKDNHNRMVLICIEDE